MCIPVQPHTTPAVLYFKIWDHNFFLPNIHRHRTVLWLHCFCCDKCSCMFLPLWTKLVNKLLLSQKVPLEGKSDVKLQVMSLWFSSYNLLHIRRMSFNCQRVTLFVNLWIEKWKEMIVHGKKSWTNQRRDALTLSSWLKS